MYRYVTGGDRDLTFNCLVRPNWLLKFGGWGIVLIRYNYRKVL